MKFAAIITAGGTGIRMGADRPKQYLELDGIPILARTLIAFQEHPMVEGIVITVPQGQEEYCKKLMDPYAWDKLMNITAGGPTRSDSVYNGLKLLKNVAFVAIHDAVRPFVSASTLTRCLETAEKTGAAIACVKVHETVKRKIGDQIVTVPRDDLWLARTPQAFSTNILLRCYEEIDNRSDITDEAMLLEKQGIKVSIVEDSIYNMKITTRDDYQLAQILIGQRLS